MNGKMEPDPCYSWALLIAMIAGSHAPAADPAVTITGGPDESAHNYAWTIQNDHNRPIVYVQFPHFRADLFNPPDGWTGAIIQPTGQASATGKCTAVVNDQSRGIHPGSSAVFAMRIGPYAGNYGARPGEGDVLIRFADGTETTVRAMVPSRESFLGRHLSLFAFCSIVIVALLVRAARKRRTRPRQGLKVES